MPPGEKNSRKGPPRVAPLPGAAVPAGQMGTYLVSLQEVTSTTQVPSRGDVYGDNFARTSSFRGTLVSWLQEHDLQHEVAGIGEASGFPLLWLTCTANVAQAITELPGIEAVVADDERSLGMIRFGQAL